jgi:uncharacterized protein (TIGR03437 family)
MSKPHGRVLNTLLLSAGLAAAAFAQQTTGTLTTTNMASYGPIVAPDSIAAGWGTNLATATTPVTTTILPTTLGNTTVTFIDSAGAMSTAQLYLVSPGQINYLIPANAALGRATVTVAGTGGATAQGTVQVSNVAPAVVTANANGMGVPAAQILRVTGSGVVSYEQPFTAGSGTTGFVPTPVNISVPTDQVYFVLYGTGIRRHSLNPVQATIGGVKVPVVYAGAQSQYAGLDQVNIGPLPQTVAGKGVSDLVLTVDGVPANTVQVGIQ